MATTKATGVHKIHSTFSTSGGVLSFYRDNASTQLAFGEDGTGLDVKLYGDTASAYVLWDESADTFQVASSAILDVDGTASFARAVGFSSSVANSGTLSQSGVAAFTGVATFAGSTAITGNLNATGTWTVSGATTFSTGALGLSGPVNINTLSVTLGDGTNLICNVSTGTKIGTASLQKIGFFGAAPRVQLAHTATSAVASTIAIAVLEGLQSLGLMTATT